MDWILFKRRLINWRLQRGAGNDWKLTHLCHCVHQIKHFCILYKCLFLVVKARGNVAWEALCLTIMSHFCFVKCCCYTHPCKNPNTEHTKDMTIWYGVCVPNQDILTFLLHEGCVLLFCNNDSGCKFTNCHTRSMNWNGRDAFKETILNCF